MYPETPDRRPPAPQQWLPQQQWSQQQWPPPQQQWSQPSSAPLHAPYQQQPPLPVPQASWPYPVAQPGVAYQPVVVVGSEKSVGLAFVLAFFFGPLGMFYSTVTGALVMLGVSVVGLFLSFFLLGVPSFLIWIGCIVWSCNAASEHNNRLRAGILRY
ncbi:hypothetical protein ACWDPV_09280 [Gordonia sp. NPDC003504]